MKVRCDAEWQAERPPCNTRNSRVILWGDGSGCLVRRSLSYTPFHLAEANSATTNAECHSVQIYRTTVSPGIAME